MTKRYFYVLCMTVYTCLPAFARQVYQPAILPVIAIGTPFTVQVPPNPVKKAFSIQVDIKQTGTIAIELVNIQTGATKFVKKATTMLAGTYSFIADLRNMNIVPGNPLTVKVTVNGTTKAYKVITTD